MDRSDRYPPRRTHLDRQRRLGNEVAGVGADDAAADQAAARLVPQGLGQAFVATERQRPAARRPRKHRFAVREPFAFASISVTPTQATSGSV